MLSVPLANIGTVVPALPDLAPLGVIRRMVLVRVRQLIVVALLILAAALQSINMVPITRSGGLALGRPPQLLNIAEPKLILVREII